MSEERPRSSECLYKPTKLVTSFRAYCKRATTWFLLVILCMIGYIFYQQAQINELSARVYGQYNMNDMDSFDYRITNLEHISNAHSARLNEAEKDIWHLEKNTNMFQWRIMQLEWLHPELTVPQTMPTIPILNDFDSNPGKTPFPLQSDEPLFNEILP